MDTPAFSISTYAALQCSSGPQGVLQPYVWPAADVPSVPSHPVRGVTPRFQSPTRAAPSRSRQATILPLSVTTPQATTPQFAQHPRLLSPEVPLQPVSAPALPPAPRQSMPSHFSSAANAHADQAFAAQVRPTVSCKFNTFKDRWGAIKDEQVAELARRQAAEEAARREREAAEERRRREAEEQRAREAAAAAAAAKQAAEAAAAAADAAAPAASNLPSQDQLREHAKQSQQARLAHQNQQAAMPGLQVSTSSRRAGGAGRTSLNDAVQAAQRAAPSDSQLEAAETTYKAQLGVVKRAVKNLTVNIQMVLSVCQEITRELAAGKDDPAFCELVVAKILGKVCTADMSMLGLYWISRICLHCSLFFQLRYVQYGRKAEDMKHQMAYALGVLLRRVAAVSPHIQSAFLRRVVHAAPPIAGKPWADENNVSEAAYRHAAVFAVYVQLVGPDDVDTPYDMSIAWAVIARLANADPNPGLAMLMITWLQFLGFSLKRWAGSQFDKLITVLHQVWLPKHTLAARGHASDMAQPSVAQWNNLFQTISSGASPFTQCPPGFHLSDAREADES